MVRMLKRVSNANVSEMRKTTKPFVNSPQRDGARRRAVKNKAAVALGKLGGRKGGLVRAQNLTSAERVAIAKKAAKARWKAAKKQSKRG